METNENKFIKPDGKIVSKKMHDAGKRFAESKGSEHMRSIGKAGGLKSGKTRRENRDRNNVKNGTKNKT